MTLAVAISQLRFRYPDSAFTLAMDSLEIEGGARVAITGTSGCGKTTLAKLMIGLLAPSSGKIEALGQDILAMSDAQRRAFRIREVGTIAQELDLLEHLRAQENILLPYYVNPALRLDGQARQECLRLAEALGLSGKLRRFPAQLSQGERQRVAIARALITKPRLLLADEPTGNLDGTTARQVLEIIASLLAEGGTTFLMITHDLSLLDFFDRRIDLS